MRQTLSNFSPLTQPKALPDGRRYANITVTTDKGFGPWRTRTVEVRMVYQERWPLHWRWLDTGQFTPDYVVEDLASAHEALSSLGAPHAAHPIT